MTQIGTITIDDPKDYHYTDYSVRFTGKVDDEDTFNQLREMFALTPYGTAIQSIPGRRPIPFDHTEDSVCTQYVKFTHGNRPLTGWYLLGAFNILDNHSPEGLLAWYFDITLYWIGTDAQYQACYKAKSLEIVTNDWTI